MNKKVIHRMLLLWLSLSVLQLFTFTDFIPIFRELAAGKKSYDDVVQLITPSNAAHAFESFEKVFPELQYIKGRESQINEGISLICAQQKSRWLCKKSTLCGQAVFMLLLQNKKNDNVKKIIDIYTKKKEKKKFDTMINRIMKYNFNSLSSDITSELKHAVNLLESAGIRIMRLPLFHTSLCCGLKKILPKPQLILIVPDLR